MRGTSADAPISRLICRAARLVDFLIRSTTLAEFWGRRWNRVVAGWLRDYLFFLLARRRRAILGICAAFATPTKNRAEVSASTRSVEVGSNCTSLVSK